MYSVSIYSVYPVYWNLSTDHFIEMLYFVSMETNISHQNVSMVMTLTLYPYQQNEVCTQIWCYIYMATMATTANTAVQNMFETIEPLSWLPYISLQIEEINRTVNCATLKIHIFVIFNIQPCLLGCHGNIF